MLSSCTPGSVEAGVRRVLVLVNQRIGDAIGDGNVPVITLYYTVLRLVDPEELVIVGPCIPDRVV